MKTVFIIFICTLSLNLFAQRGSSINSKPLKLHDFTSDFCSAYPDGYAWTQEHEWAHCCFVHDISYWVGGTSEEKAAADSELNTCVSEASFEAQGKIMEMGVVVGGVPFVGTTWRWGYGWSKMTTFKELSHEKNLLIDEKAYTILNALVVETPYMTKDQINYVMESFDRFRSENLNRLNDLK